MIGVRTYFGNHQLGLNVPFNEGTFFPTHFETLIFPLPSSVSASANAFASLATCPSRFVSTSRCLPLRRAKRAGLDGTTRTICLDHEASPTRLSIVRSVEPDKASAE